MCLNSLLSFVTSTTDFVVLFRLLVELRRVVLSHGHDDAAPGGGELELRDESAGAVPQRHLPDGAEGQRRRSDRAA